MGNTINAGQFKEMIQAASTRLNSRAEYVNSLNVFQYLMVILAQIWA